MKSENEKTAIHVATGNQHMMWIFHRAKTWLEGICLAFLLMSAALLIFTGSITGKATIFGVRPMMVTTDSMLPTLSVGEFIIGIPVEPEEIGAGEQVHAKNIAKPVHFFKACNYFRMQMEKANVSICEVTREMVADILGKSASYHYGADTIEEVFNEVHGINMEVSYEALCEADDGELSDTMQDSVLFRSEAVSQNPVEDTLIEKLDTQKKNRILREICDWASKDREVAIYLMFYVQKMKYREIADKLKLPGGITEAKRLKMRGERKLSRKYPNYEYLDAMKD